VDMLSAGTTELDVPQAAMAGYSERGMLIQHFIYMDLTISTQFHERAIAS